MALLGPQPRVWVQEHPNHPPVELLVRSIETNLVNDFSRGYDGQTVRQVRIEGEVIPESIMTANVPTVTYPPSMTNTGEPIDGGGIPPEVYLRCPTCNHLDAESHECVAVDDEASTVTEEELQELERKMRYAVGLPIAPKLPKIGGS